MISQYGRAAACWEITVSDGPIEDSLAFTLCGLSEAVWALRGESDWVVFLFLLAGAWEVEGLDLGLGLRLEHGLEMGLEEGLEKGLEMGLELERGRRRGWSRGWHSCFPQSVWFDRSPIMSRKCTNHYLKKDMLIEWGIILGCIDWEKCRAHRIQNRLSLSQVNLFTPAAAT